MTLRLSFRTRLLLLFGGLLAVVLAAFFLASSRAQSNNARRVITRDLEQDAAVFRRLIEMRSGHLLEAARLLASDFAFKTAYATGEAETVVSAMGNHVARVAGADLMLVLTLAGEPFASTAPEITTSTTSWNELIALAEEDDFGEATAMLELNDRLFQAMVVPLLAPDLEAWVVIGFLMDQRFAEDLARLVLSDVSLLRRSGDAEPWQAVASTLSTEDLASFRLETVHLETAEAESSPTDRAIAGFDSSAVRMLSGRSGDWLFLPVALSAHDTNVIALIQRSLTEELAPFSRMRKFLGLLFVLGLLLSAIAAALLARSVTKPVLALAAAAERIDQGHYEQQVEVRRGDEIGRMANSFNRMARGLADREKVRSLLGKVVSPAIAEELLKADIELGGEERLVSILFSDVRSFTTLCENRSPREILELLNLYLTEVSAVISAHNGVVDKFIGDAVMALFGAPVAHDDDAGSAVLAGLGMVEAVRRINPKIRDQGWPPLAIGVGINTDVVVAGNMGSLERLNYTVIGDGVNLASRLEGLTKHYGVPILVSEFTANLAKNIRFRELDWVRVKGKNEPVRVFEPLAPEDENKEGLLDAGLGAYRTRDWAEASRSFERISGMADARYARLATMYLERIELFRKTPPAEDWDGTHTFTEK